jgi:glyoxylase-like metal-dependent hydrolase (beta-lactamase superfamily II)
MQIGPYQIHSLETGKFRLDGGAMFGVVPKAIWARTNPSDEQNRIEMAARVLLVLCGERKILVDVGIGHKFPSKQREFFQLDYSHFTLKNSLAQHQVHPEEITDVVLTHCHFDHAAGATEYCGDSLQPAFPRAVYYLQRKHWEWALHPSEKDRGSFLFFEENLRPIEAAGQLRLLDGPCELLPGFCLEISNGHTTAMQMVKVQDQSTTLFYCSDLLPTASHLPLPYIMSYDLHPLTTLEEKRELLQKASAENWIIALEHDPTREAIRIVKGEKHFEVKESLEI